MSVSALAILGVAVVLTVALVLARPVKWTDSSRPRRRFGRLSMKPLSDDERDQYVALWAGLQERFVDSPAAAVTRAGELLDQLAIARGFPAGPREDRMHALAAVFPERAQGAQRLHRACAEASSGQVDAEPLRQALVGGRALFEELVAVTAQDRALSAAVAARRNRERRRASVRRAGRSTRT
ncbi:hypothetical protein V1460_19665 [Streptomyces sp. SCSIO 30461]|uniref:hypothetical protein n=1 Tax=Streptomyces sp. SCSIO 30461 TaxID=3118085 RepID=UPI0030CF6C2B